MPTESDLVHLAAKAAREAGRYLERAERPRNPSDWAVKGPNDYVTASDRRAEEIVTGILVGGRPDSRVVGEELAPELIERGLVWVVDPIDGTTNFVHGFPAYSVAIAATIDGVLEAGVIFDVESNRLYHATRGGGAWCGEKRLGVSTIVDPRHALIGTGFPFKHLDLLPQYQRQFASILEQTSGIRRVGSAALDLAWVAAGAFDGFWELMLAPWDMAAGLLLVREAGGVVTDLSGSAIGPAHSGVVAGNPAMHEWLLTEVRTGRAIPVSDEDPGSG